MVQHEYNWIPPQAIQEIAEFLEMSPAEAIDTATFYEEYWLKPKGKYLIQVCRSLSCEICGSRDLTKLACDKYGVELGETSADQRATVVELECLGACGEAPVVMINDVLHEFVTPEKLENELNRLPDDPHDYNDPQIDWDAGH
jgi:NADH-quinone oxidoreductase subunit E